MTTTPKPPVVQALLTVWSVGDIQCWLAGTDSFGPVLKADTEKVVEYHGQIRDPRSGRLFYIIAFEDKGKVRKFEVRASKVSLSYPGLGDSNA